MSVEESSEMPNEQDSSNKKQEGKEYASLDDFQVLRKIGEGTYSTVYKVRRILDDQIYALKKIKLDNMGKRDQESALNEVRLLASISHDNIIAYKETFYEKGCLYLVLELADNGDLFHQIQQKRKEKSHFSEPQIWQVLLQMAMALHALHSRNILHRDIKPANIFLTKQGIAKLGDLNVSKIINQLCQTQAGTPYYACPQIWKDEPYDHKSDIWSLGCTIYQMATLYPPFLGEDLQEIYESITQGNFPPLPFYYSKELQKIISKMLQKHPKKRISARFILRHIEKLVPQVYKNLSIVQKAKNLMIRPSHKHQTSLQLLRTIMLPCQRNKRYNQTQVNSYLPSPSYSRDHSVEDLADLTTSIASVTLNAGVRKRLKEGKRVDCPKGVSLYARRDKQNSGSVIKKHKDVIVRTKDDRLPQIKKKTAKK